MIPDVCFLVFAYIRHVRQNFCHKYVITYGDFMVIIEPCFVIIIIKNITQIFTEYISVFSTNAGKSGPEKLQIRTFFTQ